MGSLAATGKLPYVSSMGTKPVRLAASAHRVNLKPSTTRKIQPETIKRALALPLGAERAADKKTLRKSKFTLLMTDDELDHLRELADEEGEPASVFLRRLIKLTWESYAGRHSGRHEHYRAS